MKIFDYDGDKITKKFSNSNSFWKNKYYHCRLGQQAVENVV